MFMFIGNTYNKQTNHQVGYMSSDVGVPFPVGLTHIDIHMGVDNPSRVLYCLH